MRYFSVLSVYHFEKEILSPRFLLALFDHTSGLVVADLHG